MIDITTVGAGGGSIAWFDRDGLLKVGPASAGADPGPACYGLGGRDATVTDANLVLGRLPEVLVGGSMKLHKEEARAAIARIAQTMQKTVEETAAGMIAITVANMVRAIRTLSVERGHDPRDFALMAFGGAGPLHAREMAMALSMREIVIPAAPGLLCAQGLLVADQKEDFVVSLRIPCHDGRERAMLHSVTELRDAAERWRMDEEFESGRLTLEVAVDARYIGQNFELSISLGKVASTGPIELPTMRSLREMFFSAHERAYGFHDPGAPIEIINSRLTARIPSQLSTDGLRNDSHASAPTGERMTSFDGLRWTAAVVYRRHDLAPGTKVRGPAIIEQMDTTTPVYPGDLACVEPSGALLIRIQS